MNKKRAALALSLTLSAFAFGACANGGASSPAPQASPTSAPASTVVDVDVAQFKFAPQRLEVEAGTTVRWLNTDEILHTATSGAPGRTTGAFDGEMQGAGTAFEFTFSTPGTYSYFCTRHDFMTGEVTVS